MKGSRIIYLFIFPRRDNSSGEHELQFAREWEGRLSKLQGVQGLYLDWILSFCILFSPSFTLFYIQNFLQEFYLFVLICGCSIMTHSWLFFNVLCFVLVFFWVVELSESIVFLIRLFFISNLFNIPLLLMTILTSTHVTWERYCGIDATYLFMKFTSFNQ